VVHKSKKTGKPISPVGEYLYAIGKIILVVILIAL
jgi:hypothetical protein